MTRVQVKLTKQQRDKISRRHGAKLMKLGWNPFVEIDQTRLESASQTAQIEHPNVRQRHKLLKAYWNNIYIVQIFEAETTWGLLHKVMIRRNDGGAVHSWKDFQRIKNELFGEEATALEVYPKQSLLIDEANMYWLWILPKDFDCPIEIISSRHLPHA